MPEERERQFNNQSKSEISERERERESLEAEKLSKKALKIFKERLESSKELDEIKELKIDDKKIEIIKYFDAIVFEFLLKEEETISQKIKVDSHLELWIEEPRDYGKIKEKIEKEFKARLKGIKYSIDYLLKDIGNPSLLRSNAEKEFKMSLDDLLDSVILVDKQKNIYLLLAVSALNKRFLRSLLEEFDCSKRFQEMLNCYKINLLTEEYFEKKFEKLVYDMQSSAYAQKKEMTDTEFLRLRLINAKLGEIDKKKEK